MQDGGQRPPQQRSLLWTGQVPQHQPLAQEPASAQECSAEGAAPVHSTQVFCTASAMCQCSAACTLLEHTACLPSHGSQHQGSDTRQARQKHRQDGARDCHRGCLRLPARSLVPILAEVTPRHPSHRLSPQPSGLAYCRAVPATSISKLTPRSAMPAARTNSQHSNMAWYNHINWFARVRCRKPPPRRGSVPVACSLLRYAGRLTSSRAIVQVVRLPSTDRERYKRSTEVRHLSAPRTETPEGSACFGAAVCVCNLKNVCEAASKASGPKGSNRASITWLPCFWP